MKISVLVFMGLFLAILTCPCFADDYYWNDPSGGNFGDSDNWNPAGVPGLGDAALFMLPATYAVTLDEPRYNSMFDVDGSDVTLNLSGYEYFIEYASETGDRAATIGEYGQGGLSVNNGYVYSKEVSIGQFGDASGSLTLSDPNTIWTAWQDDTWYGVWIGEEGDARLSVLDNAQFRHGHGLSAFGENSDVVVDVNGLDSEWYVDGQFDMSVYGKTTVNITNGGRVRANLLNMANEPGSSAQINITGVDQETELSLESGGEDSLTLGRRGEGIIHIEGSKLLSAGKMIIAAEPGSSGLLEVHEGSWVDTWESIAIGGTFDNPGGVGHLSIIDDDRDNEFGIDFTPTSAEGQYMLVWPQGTITMDGGVIEMMRGWPIPLSCGAEHSKATV
jgi:T5SS/PEP-CTERM-associated repeat protein